MTTQRDMTYAERAIITRLNDGGMVSGRELVQIAQLPDTRRLRYVINRLRFDRRLPIGGWPGPKGGYELITGGDRAREYQEYVHQMGRDFFALAAVVRQVTLGTAMGQMALELLGEDDLPEGGDRPALTACETFIQAHRRQDEIVNLIRTLLDYVERNPAKFRDGVATLRRRYGAMFLSAEQVDRVRRAKAALADIEV